MLGNSLAFLVLAYLDYLGKEAIKLTPREPTNHLEHANEETEGSQ